MITTTTFRRAVSLLRRLLCSFLILLGSIAFGQPSNDSFQYRSTNKMLEGFVRPPQRAKPFAFWYWMNNNITREGITTDLEAMADVGLGGVTIENAKYGVPRGQARFMTPQWRSLFKHAAQEADRLGLEVNMINADAWSGSGGPWITQEQSMQVLTSSETAVQGPTSLSQPLRRPFVRKNFYRDIAVYAFKTPAAEGLPMGECSPRITSAGSLFNPLHLMDGDSDTSISLRTTKDQPASIDIEFPKPFTARSIRIVQYRYGSDWLPCELHVSHDGKQFTKVSDLSIPRITAEGVADTQAATFPLASFPATKGRHFRVLFPKGSSGASSIKLTELALISGARIHGTAFKAGYVRGPIEEGAVAALQPDEPDTVIPLDEIVDVTAHMKPDGSLSWNVPAGNWTILRIGHTTTGVYNQPPASKEGFGPECDKMSKEALQLHFDNFLGKIIADSGDSVGIGKGFAYAFIESWELGSQNWTPKFPEEFQERRGYDPLPYLPVMAGRVIQSREVSERFLYDVRRTIADLVADNYFGHMQTLAEGHGMGVYSEAYGNGVFDNFQCAGRIEIPMCEFWIGEPRWDSSRREIASAAHTYGRRIIDSEAFTSRPPFGNWRNYPYALKTLGDLAFTNGVNRFTLCGGSHQAWKNVAPGMMCYRWGTYYDRNVTWWDQSRAWIAYLARCQYLLQEGLFAADVAYFAGESVPIEYKREGYTPKLPTGYDHDACSTEVILERMSVEDGRLVLPDGMSYRVLVLPDTDVMTPELCSKIRDLVQAGATVISPRPVKSPSRSGYPDCDNEVKKIADRVWGDVDGKAVKERAYGKGRIIWGKSLRQVFSEMGLKPDFEYELGKSSAEMRNAPAPVPGNKGLFSAQLNYIHRVSGKTDLYFVTSQSDRSASAVCTFRVNDRRPDFWYPDTGRIEKCAQYGLTEDGRIEVPIQFDPSGSVFVVFREPIGDGIVEIKKDGKPLDKLSQVQTVELSGAASGGVAVLASEPGNYELVSAAGKSVKVAVSAIPAPIEIDGPWQVRFQKNRGAPPEAVFEELISWPQHNDAGVKYFSGTATYATEFTVPEELVGNGLVLHLDIGRVEVIASATLNGGDLGILWKPPYRAEITSLAKPGKNMLEIAVTNLWPNRMIGDEQYPSDAEYDQRGNLKAWPEWLVNGTPRPEPRRITFGTTKLWKKGDPLLASGLLGPVAIHAAARKSISMTGDQP